MKTHNREKMTSLLAFVHIIAVAAAAAAVLIASTSASPAALASQQQSSSSSSIRLLTYEEHAAALASGKAEHSTHPQEHASCDKELCASIVSYCLIQEQCNCHIGIAESLLPCPCCHRCAICLGEKFVACSDCVGIKDTSSYQISVAVNGREPSEPAQTGVLADPSAQLFSQWTDKQRSNLLYSIVRYPNVERLTSNHHRRRGHHRNGADSQSGTQYFYKRRFSSSDYELALRQAEGNEGSNMVCTAAFFDGCMPANECMTGCQTIGASFFRWFESGCCGCFGSSCSQSNSRTSGAKCRECLP